MITKTYTFYGAFSRAGFAFVFLVVAILFLGEWLGFVYSDGFILVTGFILFSYWYIPSVLNVRQVQKRPPMIQRLAIEKGWDIVDEYEAFEVSHNLLELGRKEANMKNVVAGRDWKYGDYSYAIYKKAKHGSYKAEEVHYSVTMFDLPRPLPNILFDSPKTHNRQFKHLFDKSQIHRLEGDFDRHFTTYFPPHYSIDSLSIITPEVMQAMVEASEYDFEISENKLYMYRPLVPLENIPDMVEKGAKVRQKLLNNIVTYRDERLPFDEGRKDVSIFGHQLMYNPYRTFPVLLMGLVFAAVGIFAYTKGASALNEGILYGAIMIVFTVVDIVKAKRKNRRLTEKYHRIMKISQAESKQKVDNR